MGAYRVVAAAFDDGEELAELDLVGAVLVDQVNDLLHLLPVLYQAQGDEGVLELVHADGAGAVLVERVEVVAQLLELLVVEVDAVLLAPLLQPVP